MKDKDYIYQADKEKRELRVLDPDTLELVGHFQLPPNFTMADAEKWLQHMAKELKFGPGEN